MATLEWMQEELKLFPHDFLHRSPFSPSLYLIYFHIVNEFSLSAVSFDESQNECWHNKN